MLRIILSSFIALFYTSSFSQDNIYENSNLGLKVEIMPFLASGPNNIAIIVCLGGSYFWHDMEDEGDLVASWLQRNGISAFVLKYRTANFPAFLTRYRYFFRGNRYPDPQDDLKQALRYIKKNAQKYRININQIGVMGFSAGGHLAMSSVELFEKEDWPAFIAPIYPVVTMTEDCVHKRSRRGLLGESKAKNRCLKNLLSLEKNVPKDCPPVFIVNCKDDPIVKYQNSVLLDSALTVQKVPHVYIQYERGGHGFGGSDIKGSPECRQWKNSFINWLMHLTLGAWKE